MDIRDQIAKIIKEAVLNGAFSETNLKSLENCAHLADAIIKAETDTERIAVVRKEPVLPRKVRYMDDKQIVCYELAQQDMLKAGFVQLKEGE